MGAVWRPMQVEQELLTWTGEMAEFLVERERGRWGCALQGWERRK